MNFFGILLIGIALSLDSFAVALSLGFACGKTTLFERRRFMWVIGIAHFLMVYFGWFLGENVHKFVQQFDHWVAFLLLAFLGIKMIRESIADKEEDQCSRSAVLSVRNTMVFAFALSIDALVTGFSLAMVPLQLGFGSAVGNVLAASLIIGLCAFMISWAGIDLGKKTSFRLGSKAELFGGVILILLGLKIILEHTFEMAG